MHDQGTASSSCSLAVTTPGHSLLGLGAREGHSLLILGVVLIVLKAAGEREGLGQHPQDWPSFGSLLCHGSAPERGWTVVSHSPTRPSCIYLTIAIGSAPALDKPAGSGILGVRLNPCLQRANSQITTKDGFLLTTRRAGWGWGRKPADSCGLSEGSEIPGPLFDGRLHAC